MKNKKEKWSLPILVDQDIYEELKKEAEENGQIISELIEELIAYRSEIFRLIQKKEKRKSKVPNAIKWENSQDKLRKMVGAPENYIITLTMYPLTINLK